MLINRRLDKEIALYLYNGVLVDNKKQTTGKCDNMGEISRILCWGKKSLVHTRKTTQNDSGVMKMLYIVFWMVVAGAYKVIKAT